LPKLLVYRLIEPAFSLVEPVQIHCYQDKSDRLLTEISNQSLDLVLSDTPITPGGHSKAFNHFLGESPVSVFAATEKMAKAYRSNFPRSLTGAPFLLPTSNIHLRRSLDNWFDAEGISPRIQAEIEDSALIKTFCSGGAGLFVGPSIIEEEIKRQYGVVVVGHINSVKEQFYIITMKRKLKHPGVTAILENARINVFI
jgi:LysR family transcriptional regulator, transcriptional activator of nhaA